MTIARSDWPRLLQLVEQAMDVPVAARDEWVRGLGLSQALEAALRGLIEDRRAIETEGFLAALPLLPGALPDVLPRQDAAGRIAAGSLVGPWRLLREIGQGGMSTVWLAERADGQVRRLAALKLPHAGPGHELLARRLLRERNILAGLEHRHIARLYDVGVTEAGVPYLVMEYVEGDTLTAHADARRLGLTQRLACFRQVLAAVQYAHGRLVLHRDLKPANILVHGNPDGEGEVKLLDFGIAKLLAAPGSPGATDLTQAAGRRLTPAYASPEQLRGQPLGTASDVYSLGVVLYELLSGQRPFDAPGMSLAQTERAILEQEPRPLDRRDADPRAAEARATTVASLRKLLAGDLNAIVFKALAKAPESRYASVEALDADLARWLAGQPVTAHAPGRWYFFAKFVGRHRVPVALGALSVASLATLSAVALVQARHAEQQAARAASVRDFLVAMFNETDPNRPASQELTARSLLANGRQRALHDLAGTPDLKAELLQTIGNAQANLSDFTGADQTLALAGDAYRGTGNDRGRLLVSLARVDNALALGRVDNAEVLLKQCTALAAAVPDDAFVSGTMLREQGYVAVFRADWPAAQDFLQRYLALDDRRAGLPPLHRVQVLENLATALSRAGDLPGALARIDQALDTLRQHPEISVAERMDVLNYRQDIDLRWGRYADIQRLSPGQIQECERALSAVGSACLKLTARLQAARLRMGLVDQAQALEAPLAPLLDPSSPRDQLVTLAAIVRAQARSGPTALQPARVAQLRAVVLSPASAALDLNYQLVAWNALAEVDLVARQPDRVLERVAQAEQHVADHPAVDRAELHRMQVLKGLALDLQGRHAQALAAMASLCAADRVLAGMSRVQDHLLSLNCVMPMVAAGQADAAAALLRQSLPVLRDNLGENAPCVRQAQRWLDGLQATRKLPAATDGVMPLFG